MKINLTTLLFIYCDSVKNITFRLTIPFAILMIEKLYFLEASWLLQLLQLQQPPQLQQLL
jgi:hypothetical protein